MKKVLGILLFLVAIMIFIGAMATSSGTCGENLTRALDDSGVLTISGTGEMTEYEHGNSPFTDQSCAGILQTIIVENGVTSISPSAFAYCYLVTSVSLPPTLRKIGDYAFYYSESLEKVSLPDEITEIERYSFSFDTKLYSTIGSSTAKALGEKERSFRIPRLPATLMYETYRGSRFFVY